MAAARDPGPRAGPALRFRRREAAARRRPPRAQSALTRRVARWLRPPRTLRPTRAGWVFFGLTLGVGLAALNTGNNLMYMVLSLLLSFLVLSGVLSESALRGIRVRRLLPNELVAEQEAIVGVELANEQDRVPSFAIVVEDVIRVGGLEQPAGRAFALRIAPRGSELKSYRFVPPARGPLAFVGFRVATRFPFGLFSKALWLEASREALVFPALDPLPAAFGQPASLRRGETQGGNAGQSPESAGLRSYAPGDPFRRVHWRASFRRGALLVRDQEQERVGELVVRLRTRGAAPGSAFESAVRHAASEVAASLRAGLRVGLRTDASLFPPAGDAPQRRRLLAFLATVSPEAPAP